MSTCPGCGRCRQCGHPAPPQLPWIQPTVQPSYPQPSYPQPHFGPYWISNPSVTHIDPSANPYAPKIT